MRVHIFADLARLTRWCSPARRPRANFRYPRRATPGCGSRSCLAGRRALEDFELIYTEGDSNNTRSIRVRYNAMLAQTAYDGAAPRAMAWKRWPHPTPGHVFVLGNPGNPARLRRHAFYRVLAEATNIPSVTRGRLELGAAIIDPNKSVDVPRHREPASGCTTSGTASCERQATSDFGAIHPRTPSCSTISPSNRRIRLVPEETPPADDDVGDLPAGERRRQPGSPEDRS